MITTLTGLIDRMQANPNRISPAAYDTGWMAWLYPEAQEWLLNNQHEDGSWGSDVEYYHDRIISTLSAVNALAATSTNGRALRQIEQGLSYVKKAMPWVNKDIGDTTAFELLLPRLVQIGESLDLDLGHISPLIEGQRPIYEQKMALIQGMIYSPKTVVPYSLEFIGFDALDCASTAPLRHPGNGSIYNSPSATAFVEIAMQGCGQGRAYLDGLIKYYGGGIPGFTPLDLFEAIWVLYHCSLLNIDLRSLPNLDQTLYRMQQAWTPYGLGFSKDIIADPDDTALALKIFNEVGIVEDVSVLEHYEVEDHFRCYPLERNISLDVHIHIVDALKGAYHYERREDMLVKALHTLGRYLTTAFITDKWHISPYYSTSHAISCLTGLSGKLIQDQIKWLLETQQEDGRWTFYPACPKAAIEETAHTLLALMVVYEAGGDIPRQVIERGHRYLEQHYRTAEELPALWINKGLYNPYTIVESVILSALIKYQQFQ